MKTTTSLVSMIILAAALSGCCYITPFATPEGNQIGRREPQHLKWFGRCINDFLTADG